MQNHRFDEYVAQGTLKLTVEHRNAYLLKAEDYYDKSSGNRYQHIPIAGLYGPTPVSDS
jgi:hypothetical protein